MPPGGPPLGAVHVLGKHLRFSRANLDQILAGRHAPRQTIQRIALGTGAPPRRRGRPEAEPVPTPADPRAHTHSSGA